MIKSRFLAIGLALVMANLNLYLPTTITSPCSCRSKYESCKMDHSCSHCTPMTKDKHSKEMMCHSKTNSREKETITKIFNPTCGAGKSVSFTVASSKPYTLSNHLNFKQPLKSSILFIPSLIDLEQVYLPPLDKPPRIASV